MKEPDLPEQYDSAPDMTIDVSTAYSAVLRTQRGEIKVRLLPELAPQSVNSFVFLAREGFFDGCTFHRVVPGFVAQTGDPTGRGTGGPGYTVPDEISDRSFEAGTLGMANAGPDTNGSQFFIVLDAAPHLTGRYTLFGEVEEGMDVALSLTVRDPGQGGNLPPGDRLESVEIAEG